MEYKKNEEKVKIVELEKKENEVVANIIVQVQAQTLTLDKKQIERFEMVVSERPNSDKLRPIFIDKKKSCPRQVNLKL